MEVVGHQSTVSRRIYWMKSTFLPFVIGILCTVAVVGLCRVSLHASTSKVELDGTRKNITLTTFVSPAASEIRRSEFPHIPSDELFLDWTGSALYQASQIDQISKMLKSTLYCNPHSQSACSDRATLAIELMRRRVLDFFNAPAGYSVVFTSGATQALKIVAETFPWSSESRLVLLEDNHQSVQAMRGYALRSGAKAFTMTVSDFYSKHENPISPARSSSIYSATGDQPLSLVAFPAQSNFAGEKYPLDALPMISDGKFDLRSYTGDREHRWFTLLDAAAFVPSSPLDLSKYHPDFVSISFYKIFGYPTGIGALLVKDSAAAVLHKLYYGGGTVVSAGCTCPVNEEWSFLKPHPYVCELLEDGTVSFLDIIALNAGFDVIDSLGGMKEIQKHTFEVSKKIADGLRSISYPNGRPVFTVYGNEKRTKDNQGGIVAFNAWTSDGTAIGNNEVSSRAKKAGIHIRGGVNCNAGAAFLADGSVTEDEAAIAVRDKQSCGDDLDVVDNKHWGAVRVSVGYATTMEDATRFLEWAKNEFTD